MNWRSFFSALYAQDIIRVSPKFTLTLGFRGESSTGWNEAHGRAANYTFTRWSYLQPAAHCQQRFHRLTMQSSCPSRESASRGVPIPVKTVVRAGFGIYNELQDALGYRMDQNAPFNPTYSIAALPVSKLPINPASSSAGKGVAGSRWCST